MSSALKLSSTTTCIYVRSAKTKPILYLISSSWSPNTYTTIHQRRRRSTYIFSSSSSSTNNNKIPICKSLSFSDILGFSRRALGSSSSSSYSSALPQPEPEPEPEPRPKTSKLLTIPTILTLGRVAAVPLLIATFYMDGWRGSALTTSIFIAASVTDWLDGYIARKMELKSTFGAFLDPVADKLMVAATLVLLCTRPLDVAVFGQVPWLLPVPAITIIGREITMSAVREWAASQDSKLLEAVAVNNLGKWKTATQMTALTILLASRCWSHGEAAIVVGSGVALLYTSAGLAVWSLVVYMRKIWKVLLK